MHVLTTLTRVALIALPVLLATTLAAQQSQVPNAQQGTIFRATTNYVTTDLIPRDKDGKFIPDLRPDEIKIYEDGVLQTLTNFIPTIGGRTFNNVVSGTPAAAQPIEGLVLPRSRPQTDASGRVFIIFIDDLHIEPGDTPGVKERLAEIRDTLIHDNDLVGFVSSGKSSIEISPTYDYGHRRFNEAIGKFMGGGLTPKEIIEGADMENSQGPTSLRYNTHVAFSTAYAMIEQLATITDRRKSFIYVSNGYSFDPFNDARYQTIKDQRKMGGDDMSDHAREDPNNCGENVENRDPSVCTDSSAPFYDVLQDPEYQKRNQFAETDLTNEIFQLTRAAVRANMVFYTLDPRGLIAGPSIETPMMSFNDQQKFIMQTTNSLRELAENTGGFSIVSTNDWKKGLQRIDAETSDYYIVGYTSSNPDPLKRTRRIRIEVTRPGATDLLYRNEYVLPRTRPR